MKHWIILCVLICMASSTFAQDAKSWLFEGCYKDALTAAKKENKILMVIVTENRDEKSNQMIKTIESQQIITDFLNNAFVGLKLDSQKGEGQALAKKHRLENTTGILFFDEADSLFHKRTGSFSKPEMILEELKKAKSLANRKK